MRVQRLVGNAAGRISMSSTKSSIGHLLGAAGAVEAIFSILAMRDGIAPPTINLENPSVETSIDLVPQQARKRDINVTGDSFGFGSAIRPWFSVAPWIRTAEVFSASRFCCSSGSS